MEEEETQDGVTDNSYPVPPLLDPTDNISISVPTATTGISIPVPTADVLTTGISIPVPTSNIYISVPSTDIPTACISIPIPTSNRSIYGPSNSQTANSALYKPIPFLPARPYITKHPLISKTAYETAV